MSFDITKHEWLDDDFLSAYKNGELLNINMPCGGFEVSINKDDAIAIAKHFGLIKDRKETPVTISAVD